MKRFYITIISVLVLALFLTACGGGSGSQQSNKVSIADNDPGGKNNPIQLYSNPEVSIYKLEHEDAGKIYNLRLCYSQKFTPNDSLDKNYPFLFHPSHIGIRGIYGEQPSGSITDYQILLKDDTNTLKEQATALASKDFIISVVARFDGYTIDYSSTNRQVKRLKFTASSINNVGEAVSKSTDPNSFYLNDTAKFNNGAEITFLAFGSFVDSGKRLCYVYVDVKAGTNDIVFANSNTFFSDEDGYEIGKLYDAEPNWCPYGAESLMGKRIYSGRRAKGLILAEMSDYYKRDSIIMKYSDAKFYLVDQDLKDPTIMLSGVYQTSGKEPVRFKLDFDKKTCTQEYVGGASYSGSLTYTGNNTFEVYYGNKDDRMKYDIITYDLKNKSIKTTSAPKDYLKFECTLAQKGSAYTPNESEASKPKASVENLDDNNYSSGAGERLSSEGNNQSIAHSESRIIDNAGMMAGIVLRNLSVRLDTVSTKYNVDAGIVTYDIMPTAYSDIKKLAEDSYDELGFGMGANRDGIILVICKDPAKYYFCTVGLASDIFSSSTLDDIGSQIVPYLNESKYNDAFSKYVDIVEERITENN